jgi:hypothetical protein
MIVVESNGGIFVVKGWRAWLTGAAAFLVLAAVAAAIAVVLIGVTLTIGAALLIVVPVAVGLAALAAVLGRRNLWGREKMVRK